MSLVRKMDKPMHNSFRRSVAYCPLLLATAVCCASTPAGAVMPIWTQQLGTTPNIGIAGIATDEDGNAYVSGATTMSLGKPNAGSGDAFLASYGPAGALRWIGQIGTNGGESGDKVALDG